MKKTDFSYDVLQDKISGQVFYNEMMIRLTNPVAREIFKQFRDDEEKYVQRLQKHVIAKEYVPLSLKGFFSGR